MGHDDTNFNMLSWSEDREEWMYVFGPSGAARAPTREKIQELIRERSRLTVEDYTFEEDAKTGWWSAYPT